MHTKPQLCFHHDEPLNSSVNNGSVVHHKLLKLAWVDGKLLHEVLYGNLPLPRGYYKIEHQVMECKLFRSDGSHGPISLPDGEKVVIGRGPITKINDKRVSREQVELIADYESTEVCLKQLGTNGINIGSTILTPGQVHVLGPAGTFNLIYGKYKFSIQFIDSSKRAVQIQQEKNNTRFQSSEMKSSRSMPLCSEMSNKQSRDKSSRLLKRSLLTVSSFKEGRLRRHSYTDGSDFTNKPSDDHLKKRNSDTTHRKHTVHIVSENKNNEQQKMAGISSFIHYQTAILGIPKCL